MNFDLFIPIFFQKVVLRKIFSVIIAPVLHILGFINGGGEPLAEVPAVSWPFMCSVFWLKVHAFP